MGSGSRAKVLRSLYLVPLVLKDHARAYNINHLIHQLLKCNHFISFKIAKDYTMDYPTLSFQILLNVHWIPECRQVSVLFILHWWDCTFLFRSFVGFPSHRGTCGAAGICGCIHSVISQLPLLTKLHRWEQFYFQATLHCLCIKAQYCTYSASVSEAKGKSCRSFQPSVHIDTSSSTPTPWKTTHTISSSYSFD